MAAPTLIPLLPNAPSRSLGQEDFNLKADPFIAAMPPMVVNINASLTWIGQQVTAIDGYRQAAATSASNAATSAGNAQTQVGLATDQVVLAANQVGLAQTARTAAEAARDSAQNFAAAAGSAAGLPAFTGKAGKALVVNSTATGVIYGDPYPAYAGKARMSLQVLPNEQGVRWVDVGDRIGDVLVSARVPDAQYLPADGAVYLKSAYPDLYQLLGLLGGSKANVWSDVTSGFGTNEIIALANNLANSPNTVWIGLGANGTLRRSTDNGVTWTAVAGVTLTNPRGLVYAGNSVFIAFSMSTSSCYRSTDNGATWAGMADIAPGLGTVTIYPGVCTSDGAGTVIAGGSIVISSSNYGYVFRSRDYGQTWTANLTGTVGTITSAVGIGNSGKCFLLNASFYTSGGGDTGYSYLARVSANYGATWADLTSVTDGASGALRAPSIVSDGADTWVISIVSKAFRIGKNGDGTPVTYGFFGKVTTDKNGSWLVGTNVSTNNAVDFASANLPAPAPSCLSASLSGTFMAGATAGSLRRSVPSFPYDSATQFAVPTISSAIGTKAYIKSKEAA